MFPHPSPAMGLASLDPDARALIARMSPAPSYARKSAIGWAVAGLKRYGLWGKLDVLQIFAAHNATPAALNWKGASFTASNNGATFTTDRGFTGNGASAYLDTGFAPNAGTNFTRNNHSFGVWVRTGVSGNVYDLGASDLAVTGQVWAIATNYSGGGWSYTDSGLGSGVSSGTLGKNLAGVRSSSSLITAYSDGQAVGSNASAASAALFGNRFYLLADNENGVAQSFSANQVSAFYAGAALSATEAANLHAILQAYMTRVGA